MVSFLTSGRSATMTHAIAGASAPLSNFGTASQLVQTTQHLDPYGVGDKLSGAIRGIISRLRRDEAIVPSTVAITVDLSEVCVDRFSLAVS